MTGVNRLSDLKLDLTKYEGSTTAAKNMNSVANLREEVLSQVLLQQKHITVNQRFNPDIFGSVIRGFEKVHGIDTMSTVAAIICREQDWSIDDLEMKREPLRIKECSLDVDLASFEGPINAKAFLPAYTLDARTDDFLKKYSVELIKHLKGKCGYIEALWGSQSTIVNYKAFMTSTGRPTSNMKNKSKHLFVSLPNANLSGEPLLISLGIENNVMRANGIATAVVKEQVYSCIWEVATFLNTEDNDMYNSSFHRINNADNKSNGFVVAKGPLFQILVSILFAWRHQAAYGDILFCMETYNNKKRKFNISGEGALSANGKISESIMLEKMVAKFSDQIFSNCFIIRLIALALIECKVFKMTNAEKDGVFYVGLGAMCKGEMQSNDYPALVTWNCFQLDKNILNVRKHGYDIFAGVGKTSLPILFNDWESILECPEYIPKEYDSRFKNFYPYRVRNDLAFYPPFHGILPMDVTMTVHSFDKSDIINSNIQLKSKLVKAQIYLPDLRSYIL